MKKNVLLVALLMGIFLNPLLLLAQNIQSDKNQNEIRKKYPVEMYFIPQGVTSENHAKEIERLLSNDSNIMYCEIHNEEKSKIFAINDFEKGYIEDLLAKSGVTIVNNYIFVKYNYFSEGFDENLRPKSFPKMVNTGNPKKDEARFTEEVKQWKLSHPEEWKKMLESAKKKIK